MEDENQSETKNIKLARVLISLIFGTGLFLKIILLYGQVYYEGYIHELGFDLQLFPITTESAYMWAYNASLWAGVDAINLWSGNFVALIFGALVAGLFVFMVWNFSLSNSKPINKPKWINDYWSNAMRTSVVFYSIVNTFALIAIVWVLLPVTALRYGETIAERTIEKYQTELCTSIKNDLNWCTNFEKDGFEVVGRLMFKSDNLLGIYTADGALTIAMPDSYYHLRQEFE